MPSWRLSSAFGALSRVAGLEVGDPGAARRERADPVDDADDRGAVELELEVLLDRERLRPRRRSTTSSGASGPRRGAGTPRTPPSTGTPASRQRSVDRGEDRLLRLVRARRSRTPRSCRARACRPTPGSPPCARARARRPARTAARSSRAWTAGSTTRRSVLVERPPGVGPIALEPPAARVDAERDRARRARPVARPVRRGEVGERASPERPSPRAPRPARRTGRAGRRHHGDTELVDEPGPRGSARRRRDACRRRRARRRAAPARPPCGTADVRPPAGRGCVRTATSVRSSDGQVEHRLGPARGWGSCLRRRPPRSPCRTRARPRRAP